MDYTWQFVCGKTGARYVQHAIPLPLPPDAEIVEAFWAAVTPRTRVIFLSHITSPTGLILPVMEICRRARRAGIWTIIDGAHVPGQLPLDLKGLEADFYTGNLHKWLCSPKGSAFLYVRPEYQPLIAPGVISWGWTEGASFATRHQWQGTRDLAAFLAVPAAIEFQQAYHWEQVRQGCHALALETRRRISELTGVPPITPDSDARFVQMFAAPLPECDPAELKRRLYDEYRVEVPIITWNARHFVRVSIQAYNTRDDTNRLLAALSALLPRQV